MVVIKRGLYYSYTITSQSYSAVKLISGSNGLNKLNAAVKSVDATIDIIIDVIINTECYIGGDSSFYTINYY